MLHRNVMIVGGAAALALMGASAISAQDRSLSYQQHIQCSAMFYLYSELVSDPELIARLEAATYVMMEKAQALPEGRGLTQERFVRVVGVEIANIRSAIPTDAPPNQTFLVITGSGPGLEACLDALS